MTRFLLIAIILSLSSVSYSQDTFVPVEGNDSATLVVDSFSVYNEYVRRLDTLVAWRDSIKREIRFEEPNPYYFQMLLSPTLYKSPIHQMMSGNPSASRDMQLNRLHYMNIMLSSIYTDYPWLVTQTEDAVVQQGTFRDDVSHKLDGSGRLSEKVTSSNLVPTVDEKIEVVTRRPNFWKFSGNTSLQFTQNHFSENWYQGGENNYAGNTTINLRLDFNNQKKITWGNLLEFQLGFQTSDSDERRVFRPTNNRICFTTNFGFQAFKTLYYSAQVRIQTQVVPNYQPNTMNVTSDIFSPMDVTIAPGFRYNIAYGKKKRFTGTLNIAPLAYSIRYCDRDNLVRNFGIDEGHNSVHNFGPNVTLDTNWKICNQITWTSRVYWFSNLHYNKLEWTNTVNFSFNKYLSAQLYLYPRYDDSAVRFKNENGKYFMFREYLSMGLNYNF